MIVVGDRVADGLVEHAASGQPSTRGRVQVSHVQVRACAEACPQCVPEQLVIAIPATVVVEGDDEDVVPLERCQHLRAVRVAREGVAQLSRQLVEHRCANEEPGDVLGQPIKDLLDEVVEHEPVAARERVDELGDVSAGSVGVAPCRQGSELQPCGPTLCPCLQ